MSNTLISPIGQANTLRDGLWLPYREAREGLWSSSNDFLNHYELGYHTGVDLVLHLPNHWGATPHQPIVASADGVIIYARLYENLRYWGNLIILKSTLDDDTVFYCRYGHVEFPSDPSGAPLETRADHPIWLEGHSVKKGELLGSVGNGSSRAHPAQLFPYHLHYDISPTDVLARKPGDWPGEDKKRLSADYTDPYLFTKQHLAPQAAQPVMTLETVIADTHLNIRATAHQDGKLLGHMKNGTRFLIEKSQLQNGYVKLHELNGWVLAAHCVPAPIPKNNVNWNVLPNANG
jgi:murein DD-endopeptidase MepM/ murein hydrolase activator NlpD